MPTKRRKRTHGCSNVTVGPRVSGLTLIKIPIANWYLYAILVGSKIRISGVSILSCYNPFLLIFPLPFCFTIDVF